MNILMITDNDPAGMGIAFCKAINRYTDHSCRLITKDIRYNFLFEKDLHLPWLDANGWDDVETLLRTSDVFHFHMTSDEYTDLGPLRPVDYLNGKSVLHHHHGHPDFRGNPEKYREKYRKLKRKTVVSTPDLLKLLPGSRWIPNIVPVFDKRFMPLTRSENTPVRVCQSPTRKELKNTVEFTDVLDKLKLKFPHLEGVVIENTAYDTCLSIKRSCDIHFDHMQGYFGVSSLESLSQGKPVIAGLDDWNIQCIKEFTGSDALPWIIARNRDELELSLDSLIEHDDSRHEYGEKSRAFMEDCWTERHAIRQLIDVYESL